MPKSLQVVVAPALAALVRFCAVRDWALAEDGDAHAEALAGARGSGPAAGGLRATYHQWAVVQVRRLSDRSSRPECAGALRAGKHQSMSSRLRA